MLTLLSLLLGTLTTQTLALDGYQLHQRTGTLFVLEQHEQFGTNIGVLMTEQGVLLIDPMPEVHRLTSLQQKVLSVTSKPVRFIANTHAHEDHTGGNQFFLEGGASLADSNALHVFGLEAHKVVSHTGDDTLYYHELSNTLFTGDVFDNSWHPTFYAGGIEGFTRRMTIILSIIDDQTLIVPGHGTPTGRATVERFFYNTLNWIEVIEQLHKRQMSVEGMMAEPRVIEALSQFNPSNQDDWFPPRAFQRFIERTIEQLNRKQD